jgi:ABC-type branched-subunit amino acid transport system ATPase component
MSRRPTSLAENQTETPLLQVDDLSAGYGKDAVVVDISLRLRAGEIACIIGPNGAGKSTLIKAITKEAVMLDGRVALRGQDITRLGASELARLGVGWVPQLNDVFATLTVRENLEMGGYLMPPRTVPERIEEVLTLFPILRPLEHRTAGKLSGGERKVLALGRALMPKPSLLLLDEPTASLSPEMSHMVLEDYISALAGQGVGVVLVEQRAVAALKISDRGYVLIGGRLSVEGRASELLERDDMGSVFLGAQGG